MRLYLPYLFECLELLKLDRFIIIEDNTYKYILLLNLKSCNPFNQTPTRIAQIRYELNSIVLTHIIILFLK